MQTGSGKSETLFKWIQTDSGKSETLSDGFRQAQVRLRPFQMDSDRLSGWPSELNTEQEEIQAERRLIQMDSDRLR